MRFSPSSSVVDSQDRLGPRDVEQSQPPVAPDGLVADRAPEATGRGAISRTTAHRRSVDVEQLAWLAVVGLAALLRLPALGTVPLTLADSSRALAAWQVAAGRLPASWNGDLAQTFAALLFKFVGAGDGMARLPAALMGVGLVAAFWLYRPLVGRVPALIAALAVCLSPTCVAVARSLSPYSAGALFSLVAGALLLSLLDEPRPGPLLWLCGLLALGLSSDASFLVFVLAATLFCLVEGLWKRRPEFRRAFRLLRSDPPLLRSAVLIGVAGLLLSTTKFGIASERLRSAAATSWSDAFAFSPSAPPWHFPLDALLGYEPVVALGGLACALLMLLRLRKTRGSAAERLLLYWSGGALLFLLVASNKGAGQLPALLVPLALVAGLSCSRWLVTAQPDLLRTALIPLLLAFPALVYVLFVVESATTQAALSLGQEWALGFLFLGGAGLIVLGAVWTRESVPAYLVLCGLAAGTVFGLHTLARVGLGGGDEFLVGPVATANAVALGDEIANLAPSLKGAVSVSPSLSAPLAWYTRGAPGVQIEQAARASAAVVEPVGQVIPAGFQPLVPASEIARSWYPTSIDLGGILRWLLYRQAWQSVRASTAQLLVASQSP